MSYRYIDGSSQLRLERNVRPDGATSVKQLRVGSDPSCAVGRSTTSARTSAARFGNAEVASPMIALGVTPTPHQPGNQGCRHLTVVCPADDIVLICSLLSVPAGQWVAPRLATASGRDITVIIPARVSCLNASRPPP